MNTLTLTKDEVQNFHNFLTKHGTEQFFIAKDQGAYMGANAGSRDKGTFENIIFYFEGCNPKTDDDFYETTDSLFGGDDWGERVDVDIIHTMAAAGRGLKLKITSKSYIFEPV